MSELRVIDHDGPGYPEGLLDLEDPPPLYVLGETTTAPAVAVVGTRQCTRYGMSLAEGSVTPWPERVGRR